MTATRDSDEIERLAANYSAAADGYAEFWSPVIRPVTRRLLEALPWDGARRVLDIGTGPGTLLGEIASVAPATAIVGVDRAFGMVARAPRTPGHLAVMDAMSLGLRRGVFDVAVMTFVLFHLRDPGAALAEVKRVLHRHGVFALATWGHDPVPPAGEIWNDELDAWGACDPSPQTRRDELSDTPEKVVALLTAAGFSARRVWTEGIEHQWDVARFIGLRTSFGTAKRKLETLVPEKRRAFLAFIADRMRGLDAADFLYRAETICAVATA
ncbi:MAG: methyltransferase domain-containing protein [Candidatus Rokubacteria bacterium]|nr:methyltransferase domain-containing protein [Candidatus Rokubacteria bacterium]